MRHYDNRKAIFNTFYIDYSNFSIRIFHSVPMLEKYFLFNLYE